MVHESDYTQGVQPLHAVSTNFDVPSGEVIGQDAYEPLFGALDALCTAGS